MLVHQRVMGFFWRVCCGQGRWVSGVPSSIPGAAFDSYAYDRPRSPIRVPATSPPRLVSPRRSESPRSSRCLVKFMVARLDALKLKCSFAICQKPHRNQQPVPSRGALLNGGPASKAATWAARSVATWTMNPSALRGAPCEAPRVP